MSTTGGAEASSSSAAPAAPTREIILLMVGDRGVGKTQLASRYLRQEDIPFGGHRDVQINGQTVRAKLVVTEGRRRPRAVKDNEYFENANGIVLVYDITNPRSFHHIDWWLEAVGGHRENRRDFVIMLLGNKRDNVRRRAVTEQQGQELANRHDILFYETSAMRTPIQWANVDFVFTIILSNIVERIDALKTRSTPSCICINPHSERHSADIQ